MTISLPRAETYREPYVQDRHAYLTQNEIERADAIELIEWYISQGRRTDALNDLRHEIQLCFENRVTDSKRYPHAAKQWLQELQELLALRRSVPAAAAKVLRRMPDYEVLRAAAFKRWSA